MQNPKKVMEFVVYLMVLIGIIVYLIVIKVNNPRITDNNKPQINEKVQRVERVQ